MFIKKAKIVTSAILLTCLSSMVQAANTRPESEQQLAREIYKQFIEVQSGYTTGSTTPLVEKTAKILKEAGFSDADIFIGGANPNKANLVVRYRGSSADKPILLLAHTDVVEAKASDWTMDPFVLNEKDGYFYGRGSLDDKAQAAIWIANLIQFRKEGYIPKHDIIVALTADEEGGGPFNGVDWLLKNHKDLISADYALNEGGWGDMVGGQKISQNVQVSEKYIVNFRLEVKNKGGHSSIPTKENAIYQLASALDKLSKLEFPLKTNAVTSAYFKEMSAIDKTPNKNDLLATSNNSPAAMERIANSSPQFNALLRTTCTPTLLEGGHAMNALPQLAVVTINCRILPEDSPKMIQEAIQKTINDPQVTVKRIGKVDRGPASPVNIEIMGAISNVSQQFWPNVATIPVMVTGGTDGRLLRKAGIPTYGVMGVFLERNDFRAHGQDERLPVQSFYEGQAFLYELVKKLSSA